MRTIGAILCVFGILFIVFPDLVAYIIGFFFLSIGANMLIASVAFGRKNQDSASFRVGDYEIYRRKK
jgi:multisubunit Na+/H+ antiporter MnhC subunit